jgi:RNA-directed DNA polymerase
VHALKRPETIYFLGFTLYCTRNRKRNFRVGLRTEKSRLRRAILRFQDQMRRMRHSPLREQADRLNQMLRGHGRKHSGLAAGPSCCEALLAQNAEQPQPERRVWWKQFQQIEDRFPLLQPKLHLPYGALSAVATPL